MRGLLRAVRELAKRSFLGPYLGDLGPQGGNTWTKRIPLNNAALATAAGFLVARSGAAVHCHPQTFAGFRGEIYFGEDAAPADELWQPLSRPQVSTPPNGESFQSFRVRVRAGSNLDATNELVLVVDPAPYGSEALEGQPPTPEVNAAGGIYTRIRALLRSSGAEVDLEAADGSAATRGVLGVAGLDVGNTLRPLSITGLGSVTGAARTGAGIPFDLQGAADADGHTPGFVAWNAALGHVWDAVGGAWNRMRADVGAAGTSTLRTAPSTTQTAVSARATAGAATGVLRAANARRACVLVRNLDTVESIYVDFGGTGAAVATGTPIGPGEALTFTTVEAINGIRGAAADVAVSIVDESK